MWDAVIPVGKFGWVKKHMFLWPRFCFFFRFIIFQCSCAWYKRKAAEVIITDIFFLVWVTFQTVMGWKGEYLEFSGVFSSGACRLGGNLHHFPTSGYFVLPASLVLPLVCNSLFYILSLLDCSILPNFLHLLRLNSCTVLWVLTFKLDVDTLKLLGWLSRPTTVKLSV